jgi:hypothetical protein
MKHAARRHEVELPRDWPGSDVAPAQLPVRHLGLDRRKIEIYRHGGAVGSYPPRQLTTLRALESASQRSTADVRCFRWTAL